MRRERAFRCLMMLMAMPFLFPSAPRAEARLAISPDTTVTSYQLFTVEIGVNDEIDSLMGYDVTVEFDDSYLEVVGVDEGWLPGGSGSGTFFRWMNPGCGCDSVFVNGSILGDVVDGPGTLFTITFRALRHGVTAVGVRRSDLRSGVNEKLPHGVDDAVVTIEPPGSLMILPAETDAYVFTQFQLEIAVNDEIDSLMGYDITVDFDASHLQVLNVEEGSLPGGSGFGTFFRWMNPGCGCDSVFVNGSILGHVVDGPGTLFTITFRAISVGTTAVTIRRSDLRNGVNERLLHTRRNAVAVIDYPPTGSDLPVAQGGELSNYPNPFNPSTMLTLRLPGCGADFDSEVRLDIYSVSGERVRALHAGPLSGGAGEFVWDGKNDRGVAVPSGVYIGAATTEYGLFKTKMIVVR